MTDSFELEKQFKVCGFKKKDIALALGISATSLFNKLNNIREFKPSEIARLTALLHLTTSQRDHIFFGNKYDFKSHKGE